MFGCRRMLGRKSHSAPDLRKPIGYAGKNLSPTRHRRNDMPSFITNEGQTIRAVQAGDWAIVRDVCVEMILDSPDAFGETLAEAQGRSSSEWSLFVERCANGTEMSAF